MLLISTSACPYRLTYIWRFHRVRSRAAVDVRRPRRRCCAGSHSYCHSHRRHCTGLQLTRAAAAPRRPARATRRLLLPPPPPPPAPCRCRRRCSQRACCRRRRCAGLRARSLEAAPSVVTDGCPAAWGHTASPLDGPPAQFGDWRAVALRSGRSRRRRRRTAEDHWSDGIPRARPVTSHAVLS